MSTRNQAFYIIIRRFIAMGAVLVAVSVVGFIVIELPPGDFLSTYIIRLERQGQIVSQAQIKQLRKQLGLDLPLYVRYFKWVGRMSHGDFGRSFGWKKPVKEIIAQRMKFTVVVSLFTIAILHIF